MCQRKVYMKSVPLVFVPLASFHTVFIKHWYRHILLANRLLSCVDTRSKVSLNEITKIIHALFQTNDITVQFAIDLIDFTTPERTPLSPARRPNTENYTHTFFRVVRCPSRDSKVYTEAQNIPKSSATPLLHIRFLSSILPL